MRYLITGATGFIGRHLCEALVAKGDEVVALVRTPAKAKRLPEVVEVLQGDLGLFAKPDTELPEVDVVVHLAGIVAGVDAAHYEAINFTAVQDLVDCLARQSWRPKRLVFSSSLAAAGPSPERGWTEVDPLSPIEAYGEAKARAEQVVAAADLPTTSFRPCVVLGPEDSATLTLFQLARRGFGFQAGHPPQRISVVDVRDVVSAVIAMSEDGRSGDFTYYVSHPEPTDTAALWASLGRAFGKRVRVLRVPTAVLRALVPFSTVFSRVTGRTNQLDIKAYRQMTAPVFVCHSAALTTDLGWEAAHPLDDTTAHALQGYRSVGWLPS